MSLEVDVAHRQGAFTLEARFVAKRGVTALFGRSGSGKTTLVNAIAGLVRPARARIAVDGAVLVDTDRRVFVPKHRRRVGYVFQEGRLFPHLTVRQNLLFGRAFAPRREPGADGLELAGVVDLLGIASLLERRPAGLSGGEKQRVAIGRALLARPRLLLMDEPLASLDEARRVEILPTLERLRDEAVVPIVYVSHAVREVARLATTVVILEAGRVAAVGATTDVFGGAPGHGSPASGGDGAVLAGRVEAHDTAYGLTTLWTPAGTVTVPRLDRPAGAPVQLFVDARDVMLSLARPHGISALNVLDAVVASVGDADDASVSVRLACGGGGRLVARITRKSADELRLAPGHGVCAIIKAVSLAEGRARGTPRAEKTAWPA